MSMFPDFASAPACVTCHNEHISTTKSDWVLGDLMGATTWSYPSDSVTTDEFMTMLLQYRKGVESVWGQYLAELEGLDADNRPEIGNKWPSNGLFIPGARRIEGQHRPIGQRPLVHGPHGKSCPLMRAASRYLVWGVTAVMLLGLDHGLE